MAGEEALLVRRPGVSRRRKRRIDGGAACKASHAIELNEYRLLHTQVQLLALAGCDGVGQIELDRDWEVVRADGLERQIDLDLGDHLQSLRFCQ